MRDDRGAALVACLLLLTLLTLLGAAALDRSGLEARMGRHQEQELLALYAAEAGIHVLAYWLRSPAATPAAIANVLRPRFLTGGHPVYVDPGGRSQFAGSRNYPDLEVAPMRQTALGWSSGWRSVWDLFGQAGIDLTLRVYGPAWPQAVATLESRARTPTGLERVLTVQLVGAAQPPRLEFAPGSWGELFGK